MVQDDPAVFGPDGPGGLGVVQGAQGQEPAAHQASGLRPVEHADHHHQKHGRRLEHRAHHHQQGQGRNGEHQIRQLHHQRVNPAAEKSGNRANEGAQGHGQQGAGQAHRQGDPAAEEQAREKVPPQIVAPQPVAGRWFGPNQRQVYHVRVVGRHQAANEHEQHQHHQHTRSRHGQLVLAKPDPRLLGGGADQRLRRPRHILRRLFAACKQRHQSALLSIWCADQGSRRVYRQSDCWQWPARR